MEGADVIHRQEIVAGAVFIFVVVVVVTAAVVLEQFSFLE